MVKRKKHLSAGQQCVHGKERRYCRECGGSGICPHDKRRNMCKDCGGTGVCIHGRRKSQCLECGGNGLCVHRREKSRCRDCGGASVCPHGRRKSRCKECGGTSICTHGRRKSECKECGGSGVCTHGKVRSKCKECIESRRILQPAQARTEMAVCDVSTVAPANREAISVSSQAIMVDASGSVHCVVGGSPGGLKRKRSGTGPDTLDAEDTVNDGDRDAKLSAPSHTTTNDTAIENS